jgi:hypothetical protein
MGVSTTYIGHVEIEPPLNVAERDYLSAFAASRRSWRRGGPYAVTPEDPDTGSSDAAVDRYNRIAAGQPSLWCQWVPCPRGCCLSWNGHEKFYAGASWLQYLMDHFLRPGAEVSSSKAEVFGRFTFDHRMDGVIAGRQEDTRELFLLRVDDSLLTQQVLRRGDAMPWDEWWPSPRADIPVVGVLGSPIVAPRDERGAGRAEVAGPAGQLDG